MKPEIGKNSTPSQGQSKQLPIKDLKPKSARKLNATMTVMCIKQKIV